MRVVVGHRSVVVCVCVVVVRGGVHMDASPELTIGPPARTRDSERNLEHLAAILVAAAAVVPLAGRPGTVYTTATVLVFEYYTVHVVPVVPGR